MKKDLFSLSLSSVIGHRSLGFVLTSRVAATRVAAGGCCVVREGHSYL